MKNNPSILPETVTETTRKLGRDPSGQDTVVDMTVNDASGNRIKNYADYWLAKSFTLDPGADGSPDVLFSGATTKLVLDSTKASLPGVSNSKGWIYQDPARGASLRLVGDESSSSLSANIARQVSSSAGSPRKVKLQRASFSTLASAKAQNRFATKIATIDAKEIVADFKNAVKKNTGTGPTAFAVLEGVPFPPTSALRSILELRLHVADAETADKEPDYRESFGAISFFGHDSAANHPSGHHAGHGKTTTNLSIDLTDWMKQKDVNKLPRYLWISGVFALKKDREVSADEQKKWAEYSKTLNSQLEISNSKIHITHVVRIPE